MIEQASSNRQLTGASLEVTASRSNPRTNPRNREGVGGGKGWEAYRAAAAAEEDVVEVVAVRHLCRCHACVRLLISRSPPPLLELRFFPARPKSQGWLCSGQRRRAVQKQGSVSYNRTARKLRSGLGQLHLLIFYFGSDFLSDFMIENSFFNFLC
jgi:hypothetical protein